MDQNQLILLLNEIRAIKAAQQKQADALIEIAEALRRITAR